MSFSISAITAYAHVFHTQPTRMETLNKEVSAVKEDYIPQTYDVYQGELAFSAATEVVKNLDENDKEVLNDKVLQRSLKPSENHTIIAFESPALEKPGLITLELENSTVEKLKNVFGENNFYTRDDGVVLLDGEVEHYMRLFKIGVDKKYSDFYDKGDNLQGATKDIAQALHDWNRYEATLPSQEVHLKLGMSDTRFQTEMNHFKVTSFNYSGTSIESGVAENSDSSQARKLSLTYESDSSSSRVNEMAAQIYAIGQMNTYNSRAYTLALEA